MLVLISLLKRSLFPCYRYYCLPEDIYLILALSMELLIILSKELHSKGLKSNEEMPTFRYAFCLQCLYSKYMVITCIFMILCIICDCHLSTVSVITCIFMILCIICDYPLSTVSVILSCSLYHCCPFSLGVEVLKHVFLSQLLNSLFPAGVFLDKQFQVFLKLRVHMNIIKCLPPPSDALQSLEMTFRCFFEVSQFELEQFCWFFDQT